MDSRPTTTQAFQLRINFLIDANMVAQFRRRPDAVLVFRSRKRHYEQVPNRLKCDALVAFATFDAQASSRGGVVSGFSEAAPIARKQALSRAVEVEEQYVLRKTFVEVRYRSRADEAPGEPWGLVANKAAAWPRGSDGRHGCRCFGRLGS